MPRGPKLRTAHNTRRGSRGIVHHETLEPPCPLSGAARAEYDRLVKVLASKGTLDRVELLTVASAARVKGTLDALYQADPELSERGAVGRAGILFSQLRGLLRELGLTLQPSRSVVKTNAVTEEADPIAGKIKLSG